MENQEDEPGINGQHDVAILASLPGVGRIVLATLLAEAFDPLRRRDYHARCLCGTAPVTRRSGKSMIVVRRLAAHNRLRDAVYHWARVAVQRDPTAVPNTPRARHGHARARSLTGLSLSPVPCSKTRPPSIPNTRDAMPRSRYPAHQAAGTIAAKHHLQMVGSPPPPSQSVVVVDCFGQVGELVAVLIELHYFLAQFGAVGGDAVAEIIHASRRIVVEVFVIERPTRSIHTTALTSSLDATADATRPPERRV